MMENIGAVRVSHPARGEDDDDGDDGGGGEF